MILLGAAQAFAMEARLGKAPAVPALPQSAIAVPSLPSAQLPAQLMLFELPPAAVTTAMPDRSPLGAPEMISHFSQNWSLGKTWEAPEPADEGAKRMADTLRQVAQMANEEHGTALEHSYGLMQAQTHDVRNALTGTIGWASLVPRTETNARYLDRLARSNESMLQTVQTYTTLAKAHAGKLEVAPAPARAVDLIDAAVRKSAAQAEAKNIALTFPASDLHVQADRNVLSIVLENLVGNAIKYTPEGGRVQVLAAREGDRVRFSVKDSGIGIAAEDQAKVFAGYRTESGRAMAEGTGFGLGFVSKLLLAHGSRIELESAPGQGSTFSFTLPAK
jgi:signal transduction histidine kinase